MMQQFGKTNYVIMEVNNISFSSSMIRENIDDYQKIKSYIDKRVYNYMRKNMLND